MEIIAVCSERHVKAIHKHPVWAEGKILDKRSYKYSNHWALQSWVKLVDSSPQSSQQQAKHAHIFRESGERSQNNEA
jgi:hypothetical protein